MAYNATEMLAGLFRRPGPPCPAYLPDDLRVEYEERAGIMEFCGLLPRRQAEAAALAAATEKLRMHARQTR